MVLALALPIPDPTILPPSPPASVHSAGPHAAMPGAEHIHMEASPHIITGWITNGCVGLHIPLVMFMVPLLYSRHCAGF